MRLTINDKEVEFTGNTLADLLNMHGFGDRIGIAIAVNEIVIPRPEWQFHVLDEGDEILIISPAQGG
jgi:sulfur carrier protein